MKTSEVLGWGVLVLIIVALGAYALVAPQGAGSVATSTTATSTGSGGPVTFYCSEGTFSATFSASQVALALASSTLTLPQVRSGSGIRYEATTSAGTLATFSSEGDWAELMQNGKAVYSNCVAAHSADAGAGSFSYSDRSNTFSFKYPDTFKIVGAAPGYSQDWMANATSSGKLLAEVMLPQSAYPKTNFADAKFTVGVSSDPAALASCLAYNPLTGSSAAAGNATIDGLQFVKFTGQDAAAGNRYDTTSYRIIRDGQCYALEYTIHYGVLANFPKGTAQFPEATLATELNAIALSFHFLQ